MIRRGRCILSELARDFADAHLKKGGDFLIKLFHGEGFDEYVKDLASALPEVGYPQTGGLKAPFE